MHHQLSPTTDSFEAKLVQKAIGRLNYLALHTRPEITFTTKVLSQFAYNPTTIHWGLGKHLILNLNGIHNLGILFSKYQGNHNCELVGWEDSYYGTSQLTNKSISGTIIMFYNNSMTWSTKKQPVVAQSTTKAKFIAINWVAKQSRWTTNLMLSMGLMIHEPTICNENSGAIIISKEVHLNPNSKYIEIIFQYVQELVRNKLWTMR
ncbi:hypothetical protein O181_086148 [Austropuccinia psidii MF-1]|uniref:Uncharacterized protein n=1 Tax=Austropuccinia psidii MF-1 TaxID=1389203 RepID=A0A9Q3FYS9_9BASI|nr:hypothetical protein [Austropuccinia psidii MF-1]